MDTSIPNEGASPDAPDRAARPIRAVQRVVRPVAAPLAARRVRSLSAQPMTIDAALDTVYGFDFLGARIAPWQVRSEIRALLELLAANPPRVIVEVGTAAGGALFLFARIAAPDALLISVDLPHGEFGGGYPLWRAPIYRAFAGPGQRVELLRGDSHDPAMLDRVRDAAGGRPVDFVFIDGDHAYEGAKKDFEMYGGLVRPGGVVAFHDIVPQSEDPAGREFADPDSAFCVGNVPTLWNELREQHDVEELVEDWDQGSFGIGVVHMGGAVRSGAPS